MIPNPTATKMNDTVDNSIIKQKGVNKTEKEKECNHQKHVNHARIKGSPGS